MSQLGFRSPSVLHEASAWRAYVIESIVTGYIPQLWIWPVGPGFGLKVHGSIDVDYEWVLHHKLRDKHVLSKNTGNNPSPLSPGAKWTKLGRPGGLGSSEPWIESTENISLVTLMCGRITSTFPLSWSQLQFKLKEQSDKVWNTENRVLCNDRGSFI